MNINQISISIVSFCAATSFANWVPMATLTVEQRAHRLHDVWKDNGYRLTYGIHTMVLPDQEDTLASGTGRSFAFDGPMEQALLNELKRLKDQPIKVLVPAMGSGRTVMDVLTLHKHAFVYANDIKQSAFQHLASLIKKYGRPSHNDRVKALIGDIGKALDVLDEQSVDIIYIANLFHFFDPQRVVSVLAKCKRVLKVGGKIFVAWRGTPTKGFEPVTLSKKDGGYRADCKSLQIIEVKNQVIENVQHPRFLKSASVPGTAPCTYPYYAANLADMVGHAREVGLEYTSSGEDAMFGATLTNGAVLGEILGSSVADKVADPKAPILLHLVLEHAQNGSDEL